LGLAGLIACTNHHAAPAAVDPVDSEWDSFVGFDDAKKVLPILPSLGKDALPTFLFVSSSPFEVSIKEPK